MDEQGEIPYAEPVHAAVTCVPQNTSLTAPSYGPPPAPVTAYPPPVPGSPYAPPAPSRGPTDGFAIASAICGFTAIVPFVSQLIGLLLGVVGLVRIRRRRRAGAHVSGAGWAVTGIVSSGLTLAGWVAVIVAFYLIGSSFSDSAGSLSQVLQPASAGS